MPLIHYLKQRLKRLFSGLGWRNVVGFTLVYLALSWLLLFVAGETDLVNPDNFFYWMLVTGSTVGYGDFSPVTGAGKWITALFIIPIGLSLFALIIGNLATAFADQWRKGLRGLKQVHVENHILIIGWNGPRTVQLLKLILQEQSYKAAPAPVVLCVAEDVENPLPDSIGFVRVTSFNNQEDMARANLDKAKCIILDNERDDVTMTTALFCHTHNPHAHTIAYFHDETLAPLLKSHCPNIECTPSVSVELLSKAAADPGSSVLHHELLSVDAGMTQYSVRYPEAETTRSLSDYFLLFKQKYQATIIGVATTSDAVTLNPNLDFQLNPGCIIYYIAKQRIRHFDWSLEHV